jgi:farnesyl-diphosphate farnesyltransferase
MGHGSPDLLSGLLKDVSRSFYLTLRVLPGSIRAPIGLAYLLARSSDTIADTDALPKAQRLATLNTVRQRIRGGSSQPLQLDEMAGRQVSTAERVLLRRLDEAIALLDELDAPDRARVREVLEIIVSGQALDLERFARADANHVIALENDEQLDDYTYRVAGCVGEFWTKMCRAHAFPEAALDDALLLANGVRFGKGLQLVNVLRDLPADLRLGRCYLPSASLRPAGLGPGDLLQPANEPRLRPVYLRYVQLAEDHLRAGWAYTNHLPRRSLRIRLACAWPILIGARTLVKLRDSPILDPARRVKISRREVRQILFQSVVLYSFPARWSGLLAAATRRKPLPHEETLAK